METIWGCAAFVALLFCLSNAAFAQSERSILVGGYTRSYLIDVPPSLPRPSPLVFVFHGGGGRPEGIMRTSGMSSIAARAHFIVVYPAGMSRGGFGRGGTWNIGGPNSPVTSDDVAFVRAILAQVEQEFPIDRRRIYATGESMGGMFSYRLACEMSDVFAAIAPVAATMVQTGCAPRAPVALLHIHGTADQNLPINGGAGALTAPGRTWPPPARGVDFWTQVDGCAAQTSSATDGPETSCRTSKSCRATVEYCVVNGGGHAWPGSEPLPWQQRYQVHVSQTFPASERIWSFFLANPK